MCYIQLSLLGIAGYFKVGNSLTKPMTMADDLKNYWFKMCIRDSTRAVSEKKARSNLTYQFKKKNNRLPGTKIILPGKISLVSGKETT